MPAVQALSRAQFQGAAGPVTHVEGPRPMGSSVPRNTFRRVAPQGAQNIGSVGKRTAWESGGSEPGSVMPHSAQAAGTWLNWNANRSE